MYLIFSCFISIMHIYAYACARVYVRVVCVYKKKNTVIKSKEGEESEARKIRNIYL